MANIREVIKHYEVRRKSPVREAERLRRFGQEGDSVLAHINPMEAQFLAENTGMDINPHTGLPQFGKFFKTLGRIAPQVIGTIVGSMIGGPVGATIGGSIGGGISRGPHNRAKGMMQGAATGYTLGGGAAATLNGLSGQFPMLSNVASYFPSPANQMGRATLSGGSMSPGRTAAFDQLKQVGKESQGSFFGGMMDQLKSNPLGNALLATGIMGTLAGRTKQPKSEGPEQFHGYNQIDTKRFPESKPLERKYIQPQSYTFENQAESPFYEDVNPSPEFMYKQGGHVGGYDDGGYIEDENGGMDDTVKTHLPADSYVLDATTVSLLGDGNSRNGKKKIAEFTREVERKPVTRKSSHGGFMSTRSRPKPIAAYVSGGEAVLRPSTVKALGKGDAKKGVKQLDNIRKRLREEKGLSSKILMPKAKKHLKDYMKKG